MAVKKPKAPKTPPPADPATRWPTRVVSVDLLNPADYNPRTITKGALDGLKSSIRQFGELQPIVWNESTGHVVGGHQRLEALKAMGHKEVEVKVVNFTDAQEKAANLSLNNPAIQGSWDLDKLEELASEIDFGMFDGALLDDLLVGFTSPAVTASGASASNFDALDELAENDGEDLDEELLDEHAPQGVLEAMLRVSVPKESAALLREAITDWSELTGVPVTIK